MKKYLELVLNLNDDQQREIVMASLYDLGFYGFLEENVHLKAYHVNPDFVEYLPILNELNVSFTSNIVLEQNWNAQWESSFKPIQIDDFAIIRADFHPKPSGVKYDIIITPKMSFGTGHHATTLGMIKLMKELDFTEKKVMDFGTGTGILAIIAEKCGARDVSAIDIDEWSIANTKENISRNDCYKIKVWIENRLPENETYDIILANINLHVLLENRDQLYNSLKNGGTLIISGLVEKDEKALTDFYFQLFEKPHTILKINDWLMFNYSKK